MVRFLAPTCFGIAALLLGACHAQTERFVQADQETIDPTPHAAPRARLTLTGDSVFELVPVGEGVGHALTLTNVGDAAAENIAIGAIPDSFSIGPSSTCATSLKVGAHCTLFLLFAPSDPGEQDFTLQVSYSDSEDEQVVSLAVGALAADPVIVIGVGP